MCVCVCVCVCVSVCVCARAHMCMGVYIYTHMHTCMGAHTHTHVYTCMCIYPTHSVTNRLSGCTISGAFAVWPSRCFVFVDAANCFKKKVKTPTLAYEHSCTENCANDLSFTICIQMLFANMPGIVTPKKR